MSYHLIQIGHIHNSDEIYSTPTVVPTFPAFFKKKL